MHSSIIITGLCAALALAKPLQFLSKNSKKDFSTDIEVKIGPISIAGAPAPPSPTVVVINDGAIQARNPQGRRRTTSTSSRRPTVTPKPTSSKPPVVATTKPSTTAAPTAASSAAPGTSYQDVILAEHNVHRANHSANPLTYNNTLAAYAKTIAERCIWGHDMTQGGGGYGQNIVYNGRLPWTGVNVASAAAYGITEQWYNGEEPLYGSSYGLANPNTNAQVLHFTQVVWKATRSVGCHTAQCAQGTVDSRVPTAYTVCNYFPPGNYRGQYAINVARGKGTPATHATIKWSP